MSLTDSMRAQGNWMFRYRSYLPLILVVMAVFALMQKRPVETFDLLEDVVEGICIGLSMLGLAIRVITVGYVPKRTSGRNTKRQVADELNTTGIYSVLRHPLYLGNFLMWLGIVLFAQSLWFTFSFLLLFTFYYERIMIAEEAFLKQKFGQAYIEWSERTPAFFPRFSQWKPARLPFSVRSVLRREYSGVLAMVFCFVFVEVLGDLFKERHFELDRDWVITLCVAVALYLVLRTMKKARLLDAEGR
ncbi:MAG: isoprenylcysteine carboxylmethyltransferase family protein [Candidatus Cloacimonetes bacterium]|nr:isoprenylcysteine carboxylmethyltransferase family protein [Candidatus Cloacimonadota bacterium]